MLFSDVISSGFTGSSITFCLLNSLIGCKMSKYKLCLNKWIKQYNEPKLENKKLGFRLCYKAVFCFVIKLSQ